MPPNDKYEEEICHWIAAVVNDSRKAALATGAIKLMVLNARVQGKIEGIDLERRHSSERATVTGEMVSRFLSWPLPKDFAPDCGISFSPPKTPHPIGYWPIGTNLFTADQARQMLEHVLAPSAERAQLKLECTNCGVRYDIGASHQCYALPSSDLPSNGAIAHTYGKLKAALAELLRLYDWRNELGRIERDFNHDKKQMTTWLNKYGREKHAAWDVARTTLAGAPDIDALLLHERIQTEAQARVAPQSANGRRLFIVCLRRPKDQRQVVLGVYTTDAEDAKRIALGRYMGTWTAELVKVKESSAVFRLHDDAWLVEPETGGEADRGGA